MSKASLWHDVVGISVSFGSSTLCNLLCAEEGSGHRDQGMRLPAARALDFLDVLIYGFVGMELVEDAFQHTDNMKPKPQALEVQQSMVKFLAARTNTTGTGAATNRGCNQHGGIND